MVRFVEVSSTCAFEFTASSDGFEAERIHPICDDWQESFDLKQGAESLIIEHVFREAEPLFTKPTNLPPKGRDRVWRDCKVMRICEHHQVSHGPFEKT